MGGVVRNVIPGFRISHEAIDHDVELVRAMGAELVNGKEITSVDELKKEYELCCTGSWCFRTRK